MAALAARGESHAGGVTRPEALSAHARKLRLREILEREGLGPSRWGERDCLTLARAAIGELSGVETSLALPAWAAGLSERQAILRAPRVHGSLRAAWLALLAAEPLLRRLPAGTPRRPGMLALTPAKGFTVGGLAPVEPGPMLGVIGPECALWVRAREGLRRADPAAELWEVVCRS